MNNIEVKTLKYIFKGKSITMIDKLLNTIIDISGGETVSLTYSQLETLIEDSRLVPGNTYNITDRGDRGIYVKAISNSLLSIDGYRRMLCPANYLDCTIFKNF